METGQSPFLPRNGPTWSSAGRQLQARLTSHCKFCKYHCGCNMWKQISLSVVLLIRDQLVYKKFLLGVAAGNKVMKFLTGVKRKPSNGPVPCSSQPGISKPKSWKYDESYLSFSFTNVVINREELPQCVLCLSVLAADSMKPNKLKWHLETKHSDMKNKPQEYFRRNLIKFALNKSHLLIPQLYHPKLF
jgi:hypothetical protein